ncbi:hypothetical protein EV182_002712 [Spiromyces aspiralis]|uniref:Uncharacterized protein n=1 Tax=Spiromyces aspiralis TaxID=68401 RepID=A0ACC1HUU9_9FUNG|nr:hypothetical protein EV182_002712 [Spiromyces aspiralis]
MRRGHQQTPYSLRSRINTPSRLSYASGFQPIEEGSREITAPSLGSPTVRQGIHDLDSDLMGPEHDQADSPLDRLSRHPYINPGSKRGRGGAMSLAAELGVEGSYDKTSSSDGRTNYDSDSLSDPELVAGRASGWWPTRGQLRRRVLRLIGSVSEKVSFCYLIVYFMLRESFYVLQKVLVLMLSRFIWRPMSRAGGALLFERRVLLLLCCVCAAGLAIFTSTTPTPTNVSDGAPRTHSLLGVKSWVRWWTRLDPSPFGSGTKLKPMTPEQREAFRELGSDAAFERIRQIEESLEELSRHISLHKLQSDEGRESLVQTLKELEREKDMLAHSSQQDAGRLAKLEQSITALRDESKAQRLEMEGMRRWWEASDQEIRKQGKGWSEVQRQVGMLLHDFDSFKRDIAKQQGITKDQVRVVESAVAGMKVELQNFARQSGHRGERVGNVADESQSIQMLVSQMIESRLSGLASAQPGDAAHLRDFIRESLVQFANDRLGKADYALQSAGARIIPALTTDTLKVQPRKLIGQLLSKVGLLPNYAKPPATILSPDTHLGQCWPMAGSEGQVAIRLAAPVKVAEFGLEHVAKSLAIDVRSAPRDIEVLGYLVPDSGEGSTDQAELDQRVGDLVQLALYTYEPSDTSPLQTFPLLPEAQEYMKKAMVQTIILRVNSNWGHPDHTCIYRFRVHAV